MTPIRIGVLVVLLAIPAAATAKWISSADSRLQEMTANPAEAPAVAAAADVGYCSPELKKILRRVLMSCGLVGGEAARPVRVRRGRHRVRRQNRFMVAKIAIHQPLNQFVAL